MRNIIIPFAFAQVDELIKPIRVKHKEPMQVLLGYLKRVDNEGLDKFVRESRKTIMSIVIGL